MKKSLFIISLLCFSMVMVAKEKEDDVKGAHPFKVDENEEVAEEFAHWSLTPHVGFNYFDGDFNSEMQHAVAIPNAGLDVEYSFTPVWGLGVNYMFDMYNVTGKPGFDNVDTLLNGHMHKAGLYVSMDFMNLFYPKAKKKIFSANAILGGGYAWYKSTAMYHDNPDVNPTWVKFHTTGYINEYGDHAPSYMTDYKGELYLQAGLGLEFNLNRTLALGVRATYTYFVNDYIDGRGYAGPNAVASKNNDGIVDVTLNMRFKLEAVSKTHVRNISGPDTWKKEEAKEPQYVHDTVIIKHDSIIIRETIKQYAQRDKQRVYYVYFNTNKSNLDDKGLITIQQVADVLEEDSTLYAVVTGYCDNTGSAALNYALGDKRADNVIDELREEHGIDSERVYAMGLGKLVGKRSQAAYGPNRRAVIRLVDKRTFDRMKNDLDEKRANRILDEDTKSATVYRPQEEVITIPLEESAAPVKVNEYKQRASEEVLTEKSTTLSKLARKYYNNTYCWVYIYMANKEKIPNPNSIEPGITLTIPELTQQEMRITKDQSLVLYGNARQQR